MSRITRVRWLPCNFAARRRPEQFLCEPATTKLEARGSASEVKRPNRQRCHQESATLLLYEQRRRVARVCVKVTMLNKTAESEQRCHMRVQGRVELLDGENRGKMSSLPGDR